jgi:hypothetical protein
MKLWVDDLRDPPEADWTWVQTSKAARWYLNIWIKDGVGVDGLTISLDHDLGGDDDTRSIVLWLIENEVSAWIDDIRVHTANPVGREWLEGMIDRYLKPVRT